MNGAGGGHVNEVRLLLLLNLMEGDFFSMNLSKCCGDRGGGRCGGGAGAFVVSVCDIIHSGLQDCHSCVGSANLCYAFSPTS